MLMPKKEEEGTSKPATIQWMRRIRDRGRELFDPFPYRRYMRKNRCIFIHIPKVAGTSIRKTLGAWQKDRDHCDYKVYLRANPSRFRDYYKFCFVRNPWDRVASVYTYYQQGGNQTSDMSYQKLIQKHYPTFSSFVEKFITPESIHKHLHLVPQNTYIYDHEGRLMVDFVGKMEDIERDFEHVKRELGLHRNLQKKNSSGLFDYRKLYTDALAERISEIYREDVALFHYGFEE